MPKRVEKQPKRIPATADIAPSGEYVTLQHLLAESRVRGWSDAKIGRVMLKHFGNLMEMGQENQNGECDVCDEVMADVYDVAQNQERIVHRSCRSWPTSLDKTITKALKAYRT